MDAQFINDGMNALAQIDQDIADAFEVLRYTSSLIKNSYPGQPPEQKN